MYIYIFGKSSMRKREIWYERYEKRYEKREIQEVTHEFSTSAELIIFNLK